MEPIKTAKRKNSTLHLMPTGTGEIVKKNKFGMWVKIGGNTIFIHYSDTFTDPDGWEKQAEVQV